MKDEDRLEDDLAALVRASARIPPMSTERVNLARERLTTSLLGPGLVTTDADAIEAPGNDVLRPPSSGLYTLSAAKLGGIVAVAFVTGLGVGVGVVRPGVSASSQPHAASSSIAAVAVPPPPPAHPHVEVNAIPTASAKEPPEATSAHAPRTSPQATFTATGSLSNAAAERALLDQARRALREGDGERALVLASRHEMDHPNGALKEERDVLRIGALRSLGRDDEAHAKLEAFRRRYPVSPFLPALESQASPRP